MAAANSINIDFSKLLKLVLDAENASDGFKKWLTKYNLTIRLAVLNTGTEK